VTIPRWWVARHDLSKGSRLFMAEDGTSLRIAPIDVLRETRKVHIDLDALEDTKSVKYRVWTYYMQGADEIEVGSEETIPADVKRPLREIRLDLPGLEVLSEHGQSITFCVRGADERRRLDDLIGDIQRIALSVHADGMKSATSGDASLAAEVVTREAEILRSYRAMIRKLALCSMNPEAAHESGVKDSRELVTYALLARDLNRTVYHGIYIARHVARYEGRIEGDVGRMLRSMSDVTQTMQTLAVEAFLGKDFPKAQRVMKLMTRVRNLDDTLSLRILNQAKDVRKAVTEMLIAREVRRIAGYSVAMADATANRVLSSDAGAG
jgi:phosphate uptake regulator